jgi:uroporphyrinogen decarboxylase
MASATSAATGGLVMRALRREPVDRTPVWFMRQAGRALPEYREIRKHHTLLEICRQPELCADVTMQPMDILGVDAAIIFADIMTPLIGVGIDIDIVDGVGPVVGDPIRDQRGLEQLDELEPDADIPDVLDAIRLVRARLNVRGDLALLGFSGAPFTLASYLLEGRSSRDFHQTKRMMYSSPVLWQQIMERLSEIVTIYLGAQIKAGADAVQIFDSWAGALSPEDYLRFVQPYTVRIIDAIERIGTPIINFSTGTGGFLELVRDAGGSTLGIDWRIRLDDAWQRIGYDRGIQGNMDPMVLLGPVDQIRLRAESVLSQAAGRVGHVFNLGHGVHPDTPVANLKALVEIVHEYPLSSS